MNKGLNEYTLKEFKEMEYFDPKEYFNDIIIVPTDEIHESGFRCMKFVLWNSYKAEIVGVVGGESDVIHPNGFFNPMNLSMDCLRKSRLLRIMTYQNCEVDSFIGSSFIFYGKGWDKKNVQYTNFANGYNACIDEILGEQDNE
jgi:hypothetical protein